MKQPHQEQINKNQTGKNLTNRLREAGNVFLMLFGAVGMVGVIGASTMTIMKGPVKTMSVVTKRTIAENNMIATGKLALIAAGSQTVYDCDGDDIIEPLTHGSAITGFTGGGEVPMSVGTAQDDPWGTKYGYCVWDHGRASDGLASDNDGSCDDASIVNPDNILAGADDETQYVLAIISAGPDASFDTSCEAYVDSSTPLINKTSGSDDIVLGYTYAEAGINAAGLWNIKEGEPDIAEINRDLEVTNSAGELAFGISEIAGNPSIQVDFISGLNNTEIELLNSVTDLTAVGDIISTTGNVSAVDLIASGDVSGATGIFSGTFTAGNLATNGTLGVTGISTLGVVNAGATGVTTLSSSGLATLDSLSVTNNTSISGTLDVTGDSSLSTLSTSGLATVNSLGVTNNTTLSGTLDVTGISTLGIVNAGATGVTTLSSSGLSTLDSLSVTNNATINGILDMTGGLINNVADPTLAQDAATKKYVDDTVSSGLTGFSEQDPQVETLTANNFCQANAGGDAIDCTLAALPETDPQVGTITTAGQFCRTDGTTINCDQTAADIIGAVGTIGAIDDLSDASKDSTANPNLFLGHDGGGFGVTDLNNLGIGANALSGLDNSGALSNIAIGQNSMITNTSGSRNIALGFGTLRNNTGGLSNVAVGNVAMEANTTGFDNVAIGNSAFIANETGQSNVAIGRSVLANSDTYNHNVAIGANAGQFNEGNENVFIGSNAAIGTTVNPASTDHTVAIGYLAGQSLRDGDRNILIGHRSGNNITTGADNIIIGYNVDPSSATASEELNIGDLIKGDLGIISGDPRVGAAKYCDENLANCFVSTDISGGIVGEIDDLSDASKDETNINMFLGHEGNPAMGANNDYNLAIGIDSLISLTDATGTGATGEGDGNTAVGHETLKENTSGHKNTAVGRTALSENTTGNSNIAVGWATLGKNTTGDHNTALGRNSLFNNTTGNNNTAVGQGSLLEISTGDNNTALGRNAGQNIAGDNNIAIGHFAGDNITTGNNNITIGTGVDTSSATASNELNIGDIFFGSGVGTTAGSKVGAVEYCDENLANCFIATDVSGGAGSAAQLIDADGDTRVQVEEGADDDTIRFDTAGVERMVINENGRIGIGTDAVNSVPLTVREAAASSITYKIGAGAGYQIDIANTLTSGWSRGLQAAYAGAPFNAGTVNPRFGFLGNGSTFRRAYIAASPGADHASPDLAIDSVTGSTLLGGIIARSDGSGSGGQALLLDAEGAVGATHYCDENGLNCFTAASVSGGGSASAINDLSDAAKETTGNNLFLGHNGGAFGANNIGNTAIGIAALRDLTNATGAGANGEGDGNTAVGNEALKRNTSGFRNTAVGRIALVSNTTGNSNSALGWGALFANTTGVHNTAVGRNASFNNITGSGNTIMGYQAGNTNKAAWYITAIGNDAMRYINDSTSTTSSYSTAVGFQALRGSTTAANNTGIENTAVGAQALLGNTSGYSNTAIGNEALKDNTTGFRNVAIGHAALESNITGNSNVAIGWASQINTIGSHNTSIGRNSLNINTTGDSNIAVGYSAGDNITTGGENIIIGYQVDAPSATGWNQLNIGDTIFGDLAAGDPRIGAPKYCDENLANCFVATDVSGGGGGGGGGAINDLSDAATDYPNENVILGRVSAATLTAGGQFNTFVGRHAGATSANSTATTDNNTALGSRALRNLRSGDHNTAVGSNALNANTTGRFNVGLGSQALYRNTTGRENSAVGLQALQENTIGWNNVAIGGDALAQNRAKSGNTAIGVSALRYADNNTTAADTYNTALGYEALRGSTTASANTGTSNTAVGVQTLLNNTAGGFNTAIGRSALYTNTTGIENTAVGEDALVSNTTGVNNTGLGANALFENETGQRNVAIGRHAGFNATGSRNVFIGAHAALDGTSGDRNIMIGDGAEKSTITASNELNIGDTIYGDLANDFIGIGITPTEPLSVVRTAGAQPALDNEDVARFINNANATDEAGIRIVAGETGRSFMAFADKDDHSTGAIVYNHNLDYMMLLNNSSSSSISINTSGNKGLGNFTSDAIESHLHLQYGDIRLDGGAGNQAGCLRYNDTSDRMQFSHDCTSFSDMGSGGGGGAINDLSDGYYDAPTFSIGLGSNALNASSTGTGNIALGVQTLNINTTGSRNVAISANTLQKNTTGQNNTAIGQGTMLENTTGSENIAIGLAALRENVAKIGSTAVGFESMRYADNTATSSTSENTAVGFQALRGSFTASNNTGRENTAIGYQTMRLNTTGSHNTGVGSSVLHNNTTGIENTAAGVESLLSNTTGYSNTAIGNEALKDNTTGFRNVAVGHAALESNITGNSNVAIGWASQINTTGSQNVSVGRNSLNLNTTGDANTVIGHNAGDNITTGGQNIIIGQAIDAPSATGWNQLNIGDTIFGDLANKTVAIGADDLIRPTDNALEVNGGDISANMWSSANTQAGPDITGIRGRGTRASPSIVQNNDKILGLRARAFNGGAYSTVGNIEIDMDGTPSGTSMPSRISFYTTKSGFNNTNGDPEMIIKSTGRVGIGTTNPGAELSVNGSIEYTGTITDVSDRRLKTNIKPLSDLGSALDLITKVDTYSFTMKDDKDGKTEFGVMAQELEKTFPTLVHTADDEIKTKSVNYTGLITPIIEAVKEIKALLDLTIDRIGKLFDKVSKLEQENKALKAEVDSLKSQNGDIIKRLEALEVHNNQQAAAQ